MEAEAKYIELLPHPCNTTNRFFIAPLFVRLEANRLLSLSLLKETTYADTPKAMQSGKLNTCHKKIQFQWSG